MRVITGTAKGMKLKTLEGESVRPTCDRVKEAIFSIIQFDIEGRRVLDLFSGSGQLGIEALSRGAQAAVFVDINRDAIGVIKENLAKTKLAGNASVLMTDSIGFIKNYHGAPFDIILLDPPYFGEALKEVLPFAASNTSEGGIIVCETVKGFDFPEYLGDFAISSVRDFSKTEIGIYRHKSFLR